MQVCWASPRDRKDHDGSSMDPGQAAAASLFWDRRAHVGMCEDFRLEVNDSSKTPLCGHGEEKRRAKMPQTTGPLQEWKKIRPTRKDFKVRTADSPRFRKSYV